MTQSMQKFSDFAKDQHQVEGDKISIEEVINKEIVVTSFRVQKSKYNVGDGTLLTLQLEVDGEKRIVFTGSTVLKSQVQTYKDKLPFIATIKKINKYLSFT